MQAVRAATLAFALALAVRVLFLAAYQGGSALRGELAPADSSHYEAVAERFLEGEWIFSDMPVRNGPLLPMVVALARAVLPDPYPPLALLFAAAGAVTAAATAAAAGKVFGQRAGLLAGAGAAVYYPLVSLAAYPLSENLFLPLLTSGIATLAAERNPRRWALGGALLGTACLARESGLLLLPLAAACAPRPQRARCAAAFLLAAVAVVSPWTVRNWLSYRALVPVAVGGGHQLYLAVTSPTGGTGGEWTHTVDDHGVPPAEGRLYTVGGDRAAAAAALRELGRNPTRYLRTIPRRVANTWRPWYARAHQAGRALVAVQYWAMLALAALGAWRRRETLGDYLPALSVIAAVFLTTALSLSGVRYRAPAEPFLLGLAGAGLAALLERRRYQYATEE